VSKANGSALAEDARVVVRCPGCGGERWLSYRHRNTAALCEPCRYPDSERGKPTDVERR